MFGFPNPVNEKAARVVAGVVVLTGLAILLTGAQWLLAALAYGFWARVLTGPTLSPLGRVAMRVVAPRLGPPKYVAARQSASRRGWARPSRPPPPCSRSGSGPPRAPTC
jgi:hypothetical protein